MNETRRPLKRSKQPAEIALFLGWSGGAAHVLALELHLLVKTMLEHVSPWVSSISIIPGTDWREQNRDILDKASVGVSILVEGADTSEIAKEELTHLRMNNAKIFLLEVGEFTSTSSATRGRQRLKFGKPAIETVLKELVNLGGKKSAADYDWERLTRLQNTVLDLIRINRHSKEFLASKDVIEKAGYDAALSESVSEIERGLIQVRAKQISLDLSRLRASVCQCLEVASNQGEVHFQATHIFSSPGSLESWSEGYDSVNAGDPDHEHYVRLQHQISEMPNCKVERVLVLDRTFYQDNRDRCLGVINYHRRQLPKADLRVKLGDQGKHDLAIINTQQIFAWIRAGNGRYTSGEYALEHNGRLPYMDHWKAMWSTAERIDEFLEREIGRVDARSFRIPAGFYIVCEQRFLEMLGHSDFIRRVSNKWLGGPIDGYSFVSEVREAEFRARAFNLDGSEIGICPHGIPCIASWINATTGASLSKFTISTACGQVNANIGNSSATSKKIDLVYNLTFSKKHAVNLDGFANLGSWDIDFGGDEDQLHVPHLIVEVEELPSKNVQEICRALCHQDRYRTTKGTNVHLIQRTNDAFKAFSYRRSIDRITKSFESTAIALHAAGLTGIGNVCRISDPESELYLDSTLLERDSNSVGVFISQDALQSQV